MIHTDRLDYITAHGTGRGPRKIRCTDNTILSVHAGPGAQCTPRPLSYGLGDAPADYPGPYTHLEAYVFHGPEGPDVPAWWPEGATDDDGTFYADLPQELLYGLLVAHGGEHIEQDLADDAMQALAESFLPEHA